MTDSAQIQHVLGKAFPDECLIVGNGLLTEISRGKKKFDVTGSGRTWPPPAEILDLLAAAASIASLALEVYREMRQGKRDSAPTEREVSEEVGRRAPDASVVPKGKVDEIVAEVVAISKAEETPRP